MSKLNGRRPPKSPPKNCVFVLLKVASLPFRVMGSGVPEACCLIAEFCSVLFATPFPFCQSTAPKDKRQVSYGYPQNQPVTPNSKAVHPR